MKLVTRGFSKSLISKMTIPKLIANQRNNKYINISNYWRCDFKMQQIKENQNLPIMIRITSYNNKYSFPIYNRL